VLLIVLIGVAVTVTKLAFHMNRKVEQATTDHDWFLEQHEKIKATKLERESAKAALKRHQEEVDKRSGLFSISRSSDREKAAKLNQQILDAQKKRLKLTREYNTRAGQVDPKELSGLPKHIDLE